MGFEIGGLVGLLVLIADIWAILNIIGSSASTGAKLVWVLVILVLPVLGLLIWLAAGPRAARLAEPR
ncbi:PLDc N-terminal domain-containing protein [Benzoatithermus flavus]|uniref:PLDc N-terminal domain-containing protein n=1 Tax=Benzoatithermus flavus TaxID=3108223 RepID=A0ABU8XVC5_9PROT